MDVLREIYNLIPDPRQIAAIFSIIALLMIIPMIIPMIIRGKYQLSTQLVGSILVVAVCFVADNWSVYIVSVFVIATLVTELQFLEKIAALIFNRKEYFSYLLGSASKEEVENKTKSEIEDEAEMDSPDEAEAVNGAESIGEEPEGIVTTDAPELEADSADLVFNALQFEKLVFDNLKKNQIPFAFEQFTTQNRIISGARHYLIDGIIETKDVHYLIEVKNIKRPSSLVNAVHQLEDYKSAYEKYLSERKLNVFVQPLVIIPEKVNVSGQFRGIPIVKFDSSSRTFSNLKSTYADYELKLVETSTEENLRSQLHSFLKAFPRWGFSPLRIQKWGAKQAGYEKFELYNTREIKSELEKLLKDELVEDMRSKKGNKLFRYKPNDSVN